MSSAVRSVPGTPSRPPCAAGIAAEPNAVSAASAIEPEVRRAIAAAFYSSDLYPVDRAGPTRDQHLALRDYIGDMRSTEFVSTSRFTQGEFAEWLMTIPDKNYNHYELLRGFIVMEPPAAWPHGEAEAAIVEPLRKTAREQAAGRVFGSSQGFELPSGDSVQPDVAFVSHERWQRASPVQPGTMLRIVPDLIVEILSPSTRRRDHETKKAIYEQNGVREYWLVDTEAHTILRYLLDGGRFEAGILFTQEEAITSAVLPALRLPLVDVFPRP